MTLIQTSVYYEGDKMPVSNVDGLTIRSSGPWIERKYFYLTRYADIFTRAMGKKWSRGGLTYIDLFAGPGRCLIESKGQERDGSPLIALNYEFSKYIFIESDKSNMTALRERCKKSPKFSQIEFLEGDCNAVIHKVNPTGLSLAFIDPTDIDIPFDMLTTLTRSRQVDLLLNIQFGMDLRRNFKLYLKEGGASKLARFLGGGWEGNKMDSPRDALELFKQRLNEKLSYNTVQFKDVGVRNYGRNTLMYFLVFASKHPRGLDFWRKITTKDETGQLELF